MANGSARRADDRRRGILHADTEVKDPTYDAIQGVLDQGGSTKGKWNDRRVKAPHGKKAR